MPSHPLNSFLPASFRKFRTACLGGLLLLPTVSMWAQANPAPTYYLTTLAGADYSGSIDATGSAARFRSPCSTAVDSAGNVYVADSGNHTIRKVTATGVVTTLAGLFGIPGSTDGTGSAARFFAPQAVVVDGSGNVYVADAGNGTIRKITPAGVVSTLAGSAGRNGNADGTGSAARFGFSLTGQTALVLDSAGNLFVADGNIRKITPAGIVSTFVTQGSPVSFTTDNISVAPVYTLGIDGADNLYCTAYFPAATDNDYMGGYGVIKINPAGVAEVVAQLRINFAGSLTADKAGHYYVIDQEYQLLLSNSGLFAGITTAHYDMPTYSVDGARGALGSPTGLSVDGSGNVYFADQHTATIRRVSSTGVISTLAGEIDGGGIADGVGSLARFNDPAGMALDGIGNVYVADSMSDTIRKVTSAGTVTTLAGTDSQPGGNDGTGTSAQFSHPQSVALDSSGNLYVADTDNHTIRKITPTGLVTTLAGLAGQQGYADGTGSAARFNSPSGVAVNATGNIFVCDTGNQVIRQITPAGVVTTFSGSFGSGNNKTRLDGAMSVACFVHPLSIAADAGGNFYVAEGSYYIDGALRKITASGVVSTVAFGANDQNYYFFPRVAVDSAGNVFVTSNQVTSEIKATGGVSQISAINGVAAPQVGAMYDYTGRYSTGLAVNAQGNLYFADSTNTIRQAIPLLAPGPALTITSQPVGSTLNAGDALTLTVGTTGTQPITYQWQKNGIDIPGATGPSLPISGAVIANNGVYSVIAKNSTGIVVSNSATITVKAVPQIVRDSFQIAFEYTASSVTTIAGYGLDFNITAIGSPAPNFQWQKNGNPIPRATGTTSLMNWYPIPYYLNQFSLAVPSTSDSGSYSVVVSNSAGSVSSSNIQVTIVPNITHQPDDRTVPVGSDATFSVTATGSANLTYQWRKDGVTISGATASTLTLKAVTASDTTGRYSVVVSDPLIPNSTSISNAVSLTLTNGLQAPTIIAQPVDLFTFGGSYIPYMDTLQVQASGSPNNFTYQWQKDGMAITGATDRTFSFTAGPTLDDVGTYTVVVTNSVGSVTSDPASLTLFNGAGAIAQHSHLNIVTPPASRTVAPGSSIDFTVIAGGDLPLSYQWKKNGSNIVGATNTTLNLANVTANDNGTYTVVVSFTSTTPLTTSDGIISSAATASSATLTVSDTTTGHLANETVTIGHNSTFTAGITSGSVQWQVSTDAGATWTTLSNNSTYSGATTSTLVVANAGVAQNGTQYRYVITTDGVVVTSNAAILTVAPAFFPFPTSIALDGAGNLYVSDSNADTIQKISATGQVSLVAGTSETIGSVDGTGSAARFNQPAGLTRAPQGLLYVCDTANATIRRIDQAGSVTTLAGSSSTRGSRDGNGPAALFSQPIGIALDGNGSLYVADAMNDTIRKITADGVVTTLAGTAGLTGASDGTGASARFNLPTQIAVNASGNIYVADTNNNTIRVISPAGVVTTLAGLAGVSGSTDGTGIEALFNHPGGLGLDNGGNLYVADTGNSVIREITPAGVVTTIAGLPGIAGLEDGAAGNAFFNQPENLVVDALNNIFVADTGNAAIRKISHNGVVTTLALSAIPVPSTPAPTQTPTPTITPTPVPTNNTNTGGGGGGGAINEWFILGLIILASVKSFVSRKFRP